MTTQFSKHPVLLKSTWAGAADGGCGRFNSTAQDDMTPAELLSILHATAARAPSHERMHVVREKGGKGQGRKQLNNIDTESLGTVACFAQLRFSSKAILIIGRDPEFLGPQLIIPSRSSSRPWLDWAA